MSRFSTDPLNWIDPKFHPDFDVDSAKHLEMLKAAATRINVESPEVDIILNAVEEDGVMF